MGEDPFLSWLSEQERSISYEEIDDKWPRAKFRKMNGITATFGKYKGESVSLIPKRDWRINYIGMVSEYEEITNLEDE